MTLTPIDSLCEHSDVKSTTVDSKSITAKIAEWNSTHRTKMSLNKNGSIVISINWFNLLRGKL
jgi:TnpA family transposase